MPSRKRLGALRCAASDASVASAAAPQRPPLRLSASAGSAREVTVELEILKELLGEEMRMLIREELAHAMTRHDDHPLTPRLDEHELAAACCKPPGDDGDLEEEDSSGTFSQNEQDAIETNTKRADTVIGGASEMTTFSAVARRFSSKRLVPRVHLRLLDQAFQRFGVARPPKRSDCLSQFADSSTFSMITLWTIILSCILLGFEADEAIRHAKSPEVQPSPLFGISEMVFLILFTVEVLIRLWRWRCVFFYGEDARTHWLDFLVVVFGIMSITGHFTLPGSSAAKVIRLFSFTKVLRVLRAFTMVKPLHAILKSLQSSLNVLLSSLAFVTLTIYIFALLFVLGVADYYEENGDSITEDERLQLLDSFGSVRFTMFSLLVAASDNWRDHYEVLAPAGLLYSSLFVGFVLFVQLAVLNVILGLFVDAAMKAMMGEPGDIAEEQASRDEKEAEDIKKLLMMMDADRDGRISEEEWNETWRRGKIFSYLASIGLRRRDAERWFSKCRSISSDGQVDIKAFVNGCMRFKGTASCFDVHSLRWDVKQLKSDMQFGRISSMSLGTRSSLDA